MPDEDDMIIPSNDDGSVDAPKNQDTQSEGALLDNDEQPESPSGDDGSDATDSDSGSTSDATEETEADETADQTPEVQQPERPAPAQSAPQLEDPGEFTPKGDYAFEIADANGNAVKITSIDDLGALPEDFAFKSPAEWAKAQASIAKMVSGTEGERREWEASKQQFEQTQEQQQAVEAAITQMTNEINYLESKGKLPPVPKEYENADWSDPEVMKQPGVKERMELLEYRAGENEQRRKLGLPDMSLLEAMSEMSQAQANQAADTRKQQQNAARKRAGAMVGGSGGSPVSNIPDDMIVGEGGRIDDIMPAY